MSTATARTRWQRVRSAILTSGAVLGLLCMLWTVTMAATGLKPLVLLSGSMAPALETGDLAFARSVPAADLTAGDVVSVTTPEGVRVTHRVVSAADATASDGVTLLRLKGDANASVDEQPYRVVSADRVVGSLPKAGYVIGFAASRLGVGLAVGLMITCLVLAFGPLLVRRTPRSRATRIALVATTAAAVGALAVTGAALAPARPTLAYFSDTPQVRTLDIASGKGIGSAPWLACDRIGSAPGSGAWAYYDLDESSGTTAASATGSNHGSYFGTAGPPVTSATTYVRSQPRACQPRDTGTSVLFNPTNPGAAQPGNVVSPNAWGTGPNQWNDFTISAWIRTGTNLTTGPIIVMKDTAGGGIGVQSDRRLWMTQNGKVRFGVWNGGANYISTPGRYDDTRWHLVTGVLNSTEGLKLYVDGVRQNIATTNTGAAASSVRAGYQYTGGAAYWSVGRGDSWDNSREYWSNGWIDEVGIWKRALTDTEVRDLYRASLG